MNRTDSSAVRLFVTSDLDGDIVADCSPGQTNYLLNVLRLSSNHEVYLFNGRHGEWLTRLERLGKNKCRFHILRQIRKQQSGQDIHYLFAPLKRARLDYIVQKATEMGASRIQPVITERTNVNRVNVDRMISNVIEASEQCGILTVPEVCKPVKLKELLENWPINRRIIFCDERAEMESPLRILENLQTSPTAVLIGPEGGFSRDERTLLLGREYVSAISMGPRIMRADTAGVAALALLNAVLGDWGNGRGND